MPRLEFANNEEAVAHMKRVAVGNSGFSRFLDVEPLVCWQGESELIVKIREDMTQHHGFVHGAIVGLMADNACAWAGSTVAGDVVTGSYTVSFLSPAVGKYLRAKGQVIKAGRKQIIVRSDVWAEGEDGTTKLVAIAQATIVPTGS